MADTTFAMADTATTLDPALDKFIREEVVKQYHHSLVVERHRAIVAHLDLLGPDELDVFADVAHGLAQLRVGDVVQGEHLVERGRAKLARLLGR
jgi:hypothetical protein